MNSTSRDELVYLDNAATSWPKPPGVAVAMTRFLETAGANPGRSGHRMSIAAGLVVDDARCAVADLVGIDDPLRVVFTHNVTEALNIVLRGWLRPGDRCLTTMAEHNSIRRPLAWLRERGVEVDLIAVDRAGRIDLDDLTRLLARPARLVAIGHASNVTGTRQDLAGVCGRAHAAGVPVLLDAAQTAGYEDIDAGLPGLAFIGFTGHKSLLGPTGTGGLVISEDIDPGEIGLYTVGGTGSQSHSDRHPGHLPERFEAGTLNTVGLAGLTAGIQFLMAEGVERVRSREQRICQLMLDGLGAIEGVTVYGVRDARAQAPVVSFTIDAMSPADVGAMLDARFGIMTRVGLHCAPGAHEVIGTYPAGTVRASSGPFTTGEHVERLVAAVAEIARAGARHNG